jgi:Rad3-related DNA helicase
MLENCDEKGVIHTHSYRIQSEIVKGIRDDRLLFNRQAGSTDVVFKEFISSEEPKILVTPSAFEGVDFKGDICRWQVLCKVPYPHLGDPQIRKRMEKEPEWYQWMTAVRLIQTYGRGMRSKGDFCKTYILDADFIRFFRRNAGMLPEWFREAVVRV